MPARHTAIVRLKVLIARHIGAVRWIKARTREGGGTEPHLCLEALQARRGEYRWKARHYYLAYALLMGRTYRQLETRTHRAPVPSDIARHAGLPLSHENLSVVLVWLQLGDVNLAQARRAHELFFSQTPVQSAAGSGA